MNGMVNNKIWRGFDDLTQAFGAPSLRKVRDALKVCFRRYPLYAKRFRRSQFGTRTCPMRGLWRRAITRFGLSTRDNQFYLRGNDGLIRVFKNSHNRALRRSRRNHRINVRKRRFRPLNDEEQQKLSNWMTDRLLRRARSPRWRNRVPWTPGQWMQWWQRKMYKINRSCNRSHLSALIRTIMKAALLPCTQQEEVPRAAQQTLTVGSLNIDSMKAHAMELLEDSTYHPDIFALQETKVPMNWRLPGGTRWRFINHPRPNNQGGGTGFLVRPGLHLERLRHLWFRDGVDQTGAEITWIRVQLRHGAWLYIGNVYVPPGKSITALQERIAAAMHSFRAENGCYGILIVGDFNSSWYTADSLRNKGLDGRGPNHTIPGAQWRTFFTALPSFSCVLNDSSRLIPTHVSIGRGHRVLRTLIDYAVWFGSANSVNRETFRVLDVARPHRMLFTRVSCDMNPLPRPPVRIHWRLICRPHHIVLDEQNRPILAQCDYNPYRLAFEHDIDSAAAEDFPARPHTNDQLTARILESLRTSCGTYYAPRILRGSQCRWWNRTLTRLVRKRKTLRRRLYRLRAAGVDNIRLQQELDILKVRVRQQLHTSQRKYYHRQRASWSVTNTESLVSLYRILRSIARRSREVYHSRDEISAAWTPIFNTPPPDACRHMEIQAALPPLTGFSPAQYITFDDMRFAIRFLPNRKAAGEDLIVNEILKALPDSGVHLLMDCYNRVLAGEDIPASWRRGLVCLIPKSDVGANPSASEYRPVALLSAMVKLLESILYKRVQNAFRDANAAFHFDSGGFQKHRGCTEALWRFRMIHDHLRSQRRKGVALFLDIRKAYDTVPVPNLIHKIKVQFPFIPNYIVNFLYRWLSHHVHHILMGHEVEGINIATLRGLFQGSVLACFCFNVFINDIFDFIAKGVDIPADGANAAVILPRFEGVTFNLTPPHIDMTEEGTGSDHGQPHSSGEFGDLCNEDYAVVDPAEAGAGAWPADVTSLRFRTTALGYADDLSALACGSDSFIQADFSRLLRILEWWSTRNGLSWSPGKCKWMRIGSIPRSDPALELTLNGTPIAHTTSYKYLGVVLQERPRSTYLLLDDRIDDVKSSFLEPTFHVIESRLGCNVRVGLHIITAQVIPKLMYGCRLYRLPKSAEMIWMQVCRRVLNCYRSDSAAVVRRFLGCRRLDELVCCYTVRFFLKLCRGNQMGLMPLRRLLFCALDLSSSIETITDTTWLYHMRRQLQYALDHDWLRLPEVDPLEFPIEEERIHAQWFQLIGTSERCETTLEEFNDRYIKSKRFGHPTLRLCPENANFTFRFYTRKFNPPDTLVDGHHPNCLFCGTVHGDVPAHLPHCRHPRVVAIIDDEWRRSNWSGASRIYFTNLVAYPSFSIDRAQAGSRNLSLAWTCISNCHRRLWRLRKHQFADNDYYPMHNDVFDPVWHDAVVDEEEPANVAGVDAFDPFALENFLAYDYVNAADIGLDVGIDLEQAQMDVFGVNGLFDPFDLSEDD